MVLLDFSFQPRKRLMSVLEDEEPAIESLDLGSTANTEPTKDKGHIPRELIGDWGDSGIDPFPTFEGIKAYAQNDPAVWKALNAHILNEDYECVVSTRRWPINSETILEMMLKTHFDIVNLALEKTARPKRHLMIAGGKSATAGDQEAGRKSEPDRASFFAPTTIYNSDENAPESLLVYCFGDLDREGAKERKNLIPGEIKLYYKFRREFLDATEMRTRVAMPDEYKRAQAEQVFTQIYQYMNERHSAIGYLITDQELICVRRIAVERFGVRYGVMDVTKSIPLSVERGNLNAKMALWYLHHRYGVMEPSLAMFPATPKPIDWLAIISEFATARESKNRTSRYKIRQTRAPRSTTTFTGDIKERADIPYAMDFSENIVASQPKQSKRGKSSPKGKRK
jgi:hypothetical protein